MLYPLRTASEDEVHEHRCERKGSCEEDGDAAGGAAFRYRHLLAMKVVVSARSVDGEEGDSAPSLMGRLFT